MGMFRIKLISTMNHSNDYDTYVNSFLSKTFNFFNNRFLRKKGMASTLKMEYQVFLCIFQKNSTMATLISLINMEVRDHPFKTSANFHNF